MSAASLEKLSLTVISHKLCWPTESGSSAYATDGGFPIQIQAISSLFRDTTLVVPCKIRSGAVGLTNIQGKQLRVLPLTEPKGSGIRRKLYFLQWLLRNGPVIWREVGRADAVHVPIPGDVGTIGIVFALLQTKLLFVRHCGNWHVQRTLAEKLWKRGMEHFAGGKNVMLATGGDVCLPSPRNAEIKWIFSTSRTQSQMEKAKPKRHEAGRGPKLVTVSRLEPRKGTDVVIRSLPVVLERFPDASLDIVGDGSRLAALKDLASSIGIERHVKFHGKVPQVSVDEALHKGDIFCYPTNASEGFPKVVLEAMTAGLPVISTRVSVIPSLLEKGAGILLDEASPNALAAAVIKMWSNPELYDSASQASVETASPYTIESWSQQIGNTLREAWFSRS